MTEAEKICRDARKIYRNAIARAGIAHSRALDDFLKGDRPDTGPSLSDLERRFVIEAIARTLELAKRRGAVGP